LRQPFPGQQLGGGTQMAAVDRIEGAAQDAGDRR
jgi:hypothetical protein